MTDRFSPFAYPFQRVGSGGAVELSDDPDRPYTTADIMAAAQDRAANEPQPFMQALRPMTWGSKDKAAAGIPEAHDGLLGKAYYGSSGLPWIDPKRKAQAQATSWGDAGANTMHRMANPFELAGGAVDTMDEARMFPTAESAFNGVMLAPGGGIAAGGKLMGAGEASASSLIGPKGAARLAETINPATGKPFRAAGEWGAHDQLPLAQEARAAGMSPDEAFSKHGWSDQAYGADHPWYSAIDDSKSAVIEDNWSRASTPKLGQQIEHPEFFAAYPGAASAILKPTTGPSIDWSSGGTTVRNGLPDYRKRAGDAPYYMTVDAPNKALGLNTAVHELQHIAQTEEGFPPGSNMYPTDRHGAPKGRFDTPAGAPFLPLFEAAKAAGDVSGQHAAMWRPGARISEYWNTPGEITARGEQAIHGRGMDYKTPREHGKIDTYDMGDIQPGIDPDTGQPRYNRGDYRPFDQE